MQVHLTNHYKEDHHSLGLKRPFHAPKNVTGIRSKNVGPALEAKVESTNHERKVRWNRLHQVQEGMSSSFARSASRNRTASGTHNQDAREQGREAQ